MSAHGRDGSAHGRAGSGARGPQPDGPSPVWWALLVIAAGLVGGLAAAALVHVSLVIAVIVGVVAGALAAAAFRSSGRPAPSAPADAGRPGPWPPADRDGASPARPRPAPAVSPAPAETVVQLLAAQPGRGPARPGADKSWWHEAQGAPPPPSSDAQRGPAPDLSSYLGSTVIAQCPRCGAFRLDFRRARSGWDFRCESCGHVWSWQPGSPWPPVRVAPKLRKDSRPPGP
jgi:hypothetical protein